MRAEKEYMVDEITRQIESARTIVVAGYMGLKALELEEFRNALRPLASDCMIVKNTLVSRAIAKANRPDVGSYLSGPTAIIFGRGDDVLLAKRVVQFSKEHEALKIKVGILEQSILSKEQITHLAMLPGRDVLIAKVVGSLKAPLAGIVGVLSALPRGLVVALNAIREKKEQAQGAAQGQPQAAAEQK